MRALIQRAKKGAVTVESGERRPMSGPGLVVLLGVAPADTEADACALAEKTASLRIFEDAQGKMNLSLLDTYKEALVISQFTLYADTRKGKRPSFTDAALPDYAKPLYLRFMRALESLGVRVVPGEFGDDMQVEIQNDGPVTILLELPLKKDDRVC